MVETYPVRLGSVKSKVGSLDNAAHRPKCTFACAYVVNNFSSCSSRPAPDNFVTDMPVLAADKAKSKVGSLDNIAHKPGAQ